MNAAKLEQLDGILVLDKPCGPTSAACVGVIKRRLGQKKIGHAGTLDPMASGVLLVLLGQATKIAGFLLDGGKTYKGRFTLGLTTDTYDIEGTVVARHEGPLPDAAEVARAVAGLTGERTQSAPPFSAAKHQGKALYKLARQGKPVPEKVREIHVSQAEVLQLDLPWVDFRVSVGSGTYIRSLVHSLGTRLGVGATLTKLTREYSHPFGMDQAVGLDALLDDPGRLAASLTPIADALPGWPRLVLTGEAQAKVRNGVALAAEGDLAPPDALTAGRALLLAASGTALALAERRTKDGRPVWAVSRGLW